MQNFHNFPTEFTFFFQFYFWPIPHDLKKIHIFCPPKIPDAKKGHTEEMVSFPQYIGIQGANFLEEGIPSMDGW